MSDLELSGGPVILGWEEIPTHQAHAVELCRDGRRRPACRTSGVFLSEASAKLPSPPKNACLKCLDLLGLRIPGESK